VTSATEPLARVRLKVGGIHVPDRIITAEIVTQGKPHPEPYRAGAALLGLAPEDCLVFEDSTSGVRAGRAAGCTVIATTFSHSIEALSDAHYLVTDMTAVKAETFLDGKEIALSFTPIVV
jgi:mannitol-1-/sugar-/sorbitol-6-phosphatase